MIVTMELPDDFHILNIGLVDNNDKHAVTRSFTKCELIEKAEYIERSEFTSFPADILDETVPETHKCWVNESKVRICGDWDEGHNCCIRNLNGEYECECPDDETKCMFYWPKPMEFGNKSNPIVNKVTDEVLKKEMS